MQMAPTILPPTSNRLIRATNLDPITFAPYGEVIQNPATHNNSPSNLQSVPANQGTATKYIDISHLQNHYPLSPSQKPANSVMNMFVCSPRKLITLEDGKSGFPVTILERHPFTPQTFVPLGLSAGDKETRYLVIVAPTLPNRTKDPRSTSSPPHPTDIPRRKRSLKDRLLGARPNPFTNDHTSSTTPVVPAGSVSPMRKGPGPPDLDKLQAFIARGDQAVTYGPATWHAPMVVLGEKPIDFVVVQYANGVALEDCQEVEIRAEDGKGGIVVDVEADSASLKAKL